MFAWLQNLVTPRPIPDALWQPTLAQYPFLKARPDQDVVRLLALSARFSAHKQFSGAHGLVVTDAMAIAIAAQACLPILNLSLSLYDDFKGIVVHPGPMLARRSSIDAAGVHHFYQEALIGEAMQGGPVTLSWPDVAASPEHAWCGYNVVIHEFAHKLDMHSSAWGVPNGCPPLPGHIPRARWQDAMQTAFAVFKDKVVMAARFGAPPPWLDAYGATSAAEFFAVATEAYFVNPARFAYEFSAVNMLFNAYFGQRKP